MPTGWDSILTVILFGDSYRDGLEMLLGVILFSVLAKHNLICKIWTFQFIQDHPSGLAGRAFVLG